MKTIDVINTITWLQQHVGEATQSWLLTRKIFHDGPTVGVENPGSRLEITMRIIRELAIAEQLIEGHPFAKEVISAFGINPLFDSSRINSMLAALVSLDQRTRSIDEGLWEIARNWNVMVSCHKPFEALTIPKEVSKEVDFDEILTIQIVRPEGTHSTTETLESVISDITKLYEAFTGLVKTSTVEPLQILHISSGSSLRIDLKGLGDAIKQTKNLLVEGWSLWRHRKATELNANARALLSSLKTFGEIEKLVKNGAMNRPDAEALKAKMQKAMLGLYNEGALPREIPTVESVPNHLLIELQPQKLLRAPRGPQPSVAELEFEQSQPTATESAVEAAVPKKRRTKRGAKN